MAFDCGNILVGSGTLTLDGDALGFTRNGVTLNVDEEAFMVRDIDQLVGPVTSVKTDETFTIATELVEATLENIKRGWGVNTAIDTGTAGKKILRMGGDKTMPQHQIVFSGIAPNGKQRQVTFFKVVSVDYGEVVAAKGDETVVPVTFQALLDCTKPVGEQIGLIDDEI